MEQRKTSVSVQRIIIVLAALAIPALVAVLIFMPKQKAELGFNLHLLPAINAAINFTTFLILCFGFYFITRKKIILHKTCMLSSFALGIIFLIIYIAYHSLAPNTHYEATDWTQPVYYSLLFSHILGAAVIVPMVLITLTRALSNRFDKHKKIAVWTLPIWLYVSASGVVVYLMIAPYYK